MLAVLRAGLIGVVLGASPLLFAILIESQQVVAAPVLEVSVGAMNGGGEREWKVRVAPDAALFANGGKSLAVELALEVNAGSLGGASSHQGWINNPGVNPFAGGSTEGVTLHNVNNTTRRLFAALGGSALASDQLADVLGFQTTGAGPITLTWGGHTLLAGTAYEYRGSRIAQAGMNFDGYQGTLVSDGSTGSTVIDVPSGEHVAVSPLSITPSSTVAKRGAGVLKVNNIRAAALSVHGGSVAFQPNGGTSAFGSLAIAGDATPTAKVDLANNAAIVNYAGTSPAATVRQQILAGRGGAGFGRTWNGMGITSSAAAAAADAESRSVAYAENSAMPLGSLNTFGGQPVDGTSILMAFTRTGDANLDGLVNDDDVTIIGATYAPGAQQPAWALGDFDYNGFVDDDDVTLLGAFYDPAAAPLISPAPQMATAVSAVPEPSTVVLTTALLVVVGLLSASRQERSRA